MLYTEKDQSVMAKCSVESCLLFAPGEKKDEKTRREIGPHFPSGKKSLSHHIYQHQMHTTPQQQTLFFGFYYHFFQV